MKNHHEQSKELQESLADIKQSWQDFEDKKYSSAAKVFRELKRSITRKKKRERC